MQADFDDIRFTSSDKTTDLSYWLESKTDSTTATFWVKVPSIPTAGTTIYAYYGNATTSTTGNGDNVFTFFDDFTGTTLNTTKWTKVDTGSNITQSDSLVISNGATNWTGTGVYTNTNFSRSNLIIEGKYRTTCAVGATYKETTMLWTKDTTASVNYTTFLYAFYPSYQSSFVWTNYESGTNYTPNGTLTCNTQYKIRQKIKAAGGATTQYSSDDGATWTTARDSSYSTAAFKVGLTHYQGGILYIDNVIVRQYVATEPTVTFNDEETSSVVFGETGPWSWKCRNEGGIVSDTCSAYQSDMSILNVKNPYQIDAVNKPSNYWYCSGYLDSTNTYQTGRSGSLDFEFDYNDSGVGNTLRNYRFAFSTTSDPDDTSAVRVPIDNVDYDLEWTNISSPYVAIGETVSASDKTSVKITPSQTLGQIGYNSTYNWWVKLKNSIGVDSGWISSNSSFATPARKAPIVRFVSSSYIINDRPIRICSTADITNTSDPCYAACWRGTVPPINTDLGTTYWKCSICYDSSNQLTPCSSANSNSFEWILPSGITFNTGSESSTENPELIFSSTGTVKLKITDSNTTVTCGYQRSQFSDTSSIGAKAKWIEE